MSYFVSVLVPVNPGPDPKMTADGVFAETADGISYMSVSTPRDMVRVQIGDDGTWSVTRPPVVNWQN